MDTSIQTLKLKLIKRNDRPSFEYEDTIFLLDTGAHIPVWCGGEELFAYTYPDAIKTDHVAHISGFGSGFRTADVYIIPIFILSDNNAIFRIKNLHVAVMDYDKIKFDFILSSTMFSKTDYLIANSENTLSIMFADKEFHCTPVNKNGSVDKIAVWIQQ